MLLVGANQRVSVGEAAQFLQRGANVTAVQGVSHAEKLGLARDAKVCFVHNLIFVDAGYLERALSSGLHSLRSPLHLDFLDEDGAVRDKPVRGWGPFYIPQVKSRMFEAAQSGCVLAVLSDPWNLVERYFAKDEYFSVRTSRDLFRLVRAVRTDPRRYTAMATLAGKRARRYTVQSLSQRIEEIAGKRRSDHGR